MCLWRQWPLEHRSVTPQTGRLVPTDPKTNLRDLCPEKHSPRNDSAQNPPPPRPVRRAGESEITHVGKKASSEFTSDFSLFW